MKQLILNPDMIEQIILDKNNGYTFDQLNIKYRLSRTTITRIVKNPEKYKPQTKVVLTELLCSFCKILKSITEFYTDTSKKTGYSSYCKECSAKHNKNYYQTNKLFIIKHNKLYALNNKDRLEKYQSNYREQHRERANQYAKQYRRNNRQIINQKRRIARNIDINFKLGENLRRRVNRAIEINQKAGSAVRDLGCSIEDFKKYIEKLFQPGMSWYNYGRDGWHLDHIIPLSSFDLSNREQFLKAAHYTNYQPLWAQDNYRKGSKLPK